LNILFHNCYQGLNDNNQLFESRNAAIGDDLLRPFQVLKDLAEKRGLCVGTRSVISPDRADVIVFVDLPDTTRPDVRELLDSGKPLYLLIFESILIKPLDRAGDLLNRFRKIFTYDDSLVDGVKFIKINYSFDLPREIVVDSRREKKLCTMIAGNKLIRHPQELYSSRIEAIRWFENNHPEDFDLYGVGWKDHFFNNRSPLRVLNRFPLLRRALAASYPSYRGTVERKRPILDGYKFAICYENVRDVPGYITEKIFDCLFAGCIPIYRGASNITAHIPADCFIDFRDYNTYEELYRYISTVGADRHRTYIECINSFLSSNQALSFSNDVFGNTVIEEIING